MMIDHAASTGLPGHGERVRHAAPATDERSREGRGDPRPAPSDHGPGTPTGREEGAVHPERSGIPGGATAPTPEGCAPQSAAAGTPGHATALASRPSRTPPRRRLPAQAPRTTADRALHPGPGIAPGEREPQLGLQEGAWRTARAGGEGGRVHRLGDLEGGRDRSRAPALPQHLGRLPVLTGRRPARMRLFRDGHPVRGAAVRLRRYRAHQPTDGSGSWAPPRTRPPPGWRKPRRISSWTSRTPAAGPGS